MIHTKDIYIKNMHRKRSEGFFKNTLFVIFAVEEEGETWFYLEGETFETVGSATFTGVITDNHNSVVRPGCYDVDNSRFVQGDEDCKDLAIKKIVFYSRDYSMLVYPEEKVEVSGKVEKVTRKHGEPYHRIVVGYFNTYMSEKRNEEYIRVVQDG